MTRSEYPHLFVKNTAKAEDYKSRGRGGGLKLPSRDRHQHGRVLRRQFEEVVQAGIERRKQISVGVEGAQRGLYVQFQSDPDFSLALERLESKRHQIELVAAQRIGNRQFAVVYVPDAAVGHFLQRFEEYVKEETKTAKPKNRHLAESIAEIRLATLRSLWTDDQHLYPESDATIAWEVWLRNHDGDELSRFETFARLQALDVGRKYIDLFPDRTVVLAHGSPRQLSGSIDVLSDIAELRKAKETPTCFEPMTPWERADLVKSLAGRLKPAIGDVPVVCLMDTGVNRGHPLLSQSLSQTDVHTYEPQWGAADHDGHGTEMAGLALLGDLVEPLRDSGAVVLSHGLESVKILPPDGANPQELWGRITEESASRVEVSAPERKRIFSVAVAATDSRDRGSPSSWSGAIDALAAGVDAARRDLARLFTVCAGNRSLDFEGNYLEVCVLDSIHDPAQAWNAVTVGAYTAKALIEEDEPHLAGWRPIAEPGELAPDSTTSCVWETQWPIKPDVVMEGGNMGTDANGGQKDHLDCLSLLTTHYQPLVRPFVTTGGTSAATSLAARLGAMVLASYPHAWPETIRAIIVHSARWTSRMMQKVNKAASKQQLEYLLRCYGFGVPDASRALASTKNSLTLIAQERVVPFDRGKMKHMHLHELPWPTDVLRDLGEVEVEMRVTLSYFVEPNPARRGWKRRHRYASHGLRFDVKTPTETVTEFRKRLNKQALEEEGEKPTTKGDAPRWLLGPRLRSKGSIHCDVWRGPAADLAERDVVGVFPVSGWWKERRISKTTRYSLVVSIETPEVDVDIYTPVALKIGIPVTI